MKQKVIFRASAPAICMYGGVPHAMDGGLRDAIVSLPASACLWLLEKSLEHAELQAYDV